jgi:hypothetical protein
MGKGCGHAVAVMQADGAEISSCIGRREDQRAGYIGIPEAGIVRRVHRLRLERICSRSSIGMMFPKVIIGYTPLSTFNLLEQPLASPTCSASQTHRPT